MPTVTTTTTPCACCDAFPCCLPCQDNPPPDITAAFDAAGANDIQGAFTLTWNGSDGFEADIVPTGGSCSGKASHLKIYCESSVWKMSLTAIDSGACNIGGGWTPVSSGCGDTAGAGWSNRYVISPLASGAGCANVNGVGLTVTGPGVGSCP